MFSALEGLFAWTRGLPEYAQFFGYLMVICFALVLVGVAMRMWERRGRGHGLLDPPRLKVSRRERRALKRIGISPGEPSDIRRERRQEKRAEKLADAILKYHGIHVTECPREADIEGFQFVAREGEWDYTLCRNADCSICPAYCPKPLEMDASEREFTEAYWGIGS